VGVDDGVRLVRLSANRILRHSEDTDDLSSRAHSRKRTHSAENSSSPALVHVHGLHRARGLEVETSGVVAETLANQRKELLSVRKQEYRHRK